MSAALERSDDELGPWNPGISSSIPRRLLPRSTIFSPDNVFTSVELASELHGVTGLALSELVAFRPQRLALHEVLIRVTADLCVSDGSRYEDLGINFRGMVAAILARHVEPRMSEIVAAYDDTRGRLEALIRTELQAAMSPPVAKKEGAAKKRRLFAFPLLQRRSEVTPHTKVKPEFSLPRAVSEWEAKAKAVDDELHAAALSALAKVAQALHHHNGHSWVAPDLFVAVAVNVASNAFCSRQIGCLIEPCVLEAAKTEGYRFLPAQPCPIVLNTKGPSASGKSTLRPLQRLFTGTIGVRWDEFALISPDIWRKQLLDYSSLGPDHRYGGMLTSDEVTIIDQKLDCYMARRAEQGQIPHFVIDRFRFGSFAAESENAAGNLLSRFGQQIYFFFLITPPQDIVERAWKRGLQYGRYKAVDDLLAHSVEAYSGMPRLFQAWALRVDKRVHYEFLDNSVPFGRRPRTVAFSSNGRMVVFDVKVMLDVGRFRGVNIHATAPGELYEGNDDVRRAPTSHADFLVQCVRQLREVVFADQTNGRIYLQFVSARVTWVDPDALKIMLADADTAAGIAAIAPGIAAASYPVVDKPRYVKDIQEHVSTLGEWGAQQP